MSLLPIMSQGQQVYDRFITNNKHEDFRIYTCSSLKVEPQSFVYKQERQ